MQLPKELLNYAIDIAKGNTAFVGDDYYENQIENLEKKKAELEEEIKELRKNNEERKNRKQIIKDFLQSIGQEL